MNVVVAPIRVLVVDDDPLVRSALALMLGGTDELCLVGEAADGVAALRMVDSHRPDVVLMDIRMPVMDGLEATSRLTRVDPSPRVIVLTTFDADDYVVSAVAAGADGFLLKDTPPGEIVAAIRAVVSGDPMLSPSATASLIRRVRDGQDERSDQATARLERLTDREREVALAVGHGLTNAEISRRLFMSVPTVKAHVSRLFEKLEVTNRVQIAICVHNAGLI